MKKTLILLAMMLFGLFLTGCKEVPVEEPTKELDHNLVHHNKLEPTCTEKGHREYDTCSKCDYTTYEELPSKGHTPSEWIVDINPTCTTEGTQHKECVVCKEVLGTETIDALGHEYVHHNAVKPTSTASGKEYDTCSRCDYSTYDELSEVEELYIKETFCNHVHSQSKYSKITPDDVKIKYYLGEYNNAYVAVIEGYKMVTGAYITHYYVQVENDIYLFKFLPEYIGVCSNNNFYNIIKTCELGLLTSEDVREIYDIFMKYFEN